MTDGTIKRDVRKTKFCAQVRRRARSLARSRAHNHRRAHTCPGLACVAVAAVLRCPGSTALLAAAAAGSSAHTPCSSLHASAIRTAPYPPTPIAVQGGADVPVAPSLPPEAEAEPIGLYRARRSACAPTHSRAPREYAPPPTHVLAPARPPARPPAHYLQRPFPCHGMRRLRSAAVRAGCSGSALLHRHGPTPHDLLPAAGRHCRRRY